MPAAVPSVNSIVARVGRQSRGCRSDEPVVRRRERHHVPREPEDVVRAPALGRPAPCRPCSRGSSTSRTPARASEIRRSDRPSSRTHTRRDWPPFSVNDLLAPNDVAVEGEPHGGERRIEVRVPVRAGHGVAVRRCCRSSSPGSSGRPTSPSGSGRSRTTGFPARPRTRPAPTGRRSTRPEPITGGRYRRVQRVVLHVPVRLVHQDALDLGGRPARVELAEQDVATPETCGAAIDVPDSAAASLPGPHRRGRDREARRGDVGLQVVREPSRALRREARSSRRRSRASASSVVADRRR